MHRLARRARRLSRGQLTETAIICVVGAAAGLVLTWWLLPVMLAVYPAAIPVDADVRIDLRVVLPMIGVVAVAAMIAGLVPALRAGASPALVGARRDVVA